MRFVGLYCSLKYYRTFRHISFFFFQDFMVNSIFKLETLRSFYDVYVNQVVDMYAAEGLLRFL